MTSLGTGALTAAYVAVCASLLALLLTVRWPWRLKAAAIVMLSVFYVVTYAAWPALLGWPTRQDLPAQFNLLGGFLQPPDELTGTKGAIYLWATDLGVHAGQDQPRAYELPYSPELGAKVSEAIGKLHKNTPQLGKTGAEDSKPGAKAISGRQLGQKSAKLDFYDMPAPSVPEK